MKASHHVFVFQKGSLTEAITGKNNKHQQFDSTFDASGTQYTCRSPEGKKLKATEFPRRQ